MSRFISFSLGLLLISAIVALPAADERVLVKRGHWPVMVRPLPGNSGAAEICSSLGPGDVEFIRDGERLEVTAIGPRPLPRLHALLIDTSNSMNERLQTGTRFDEAKQAAIEYIDSVPAGESILVASFNESMVLGTPPTRDRERARRAVREFETSYYTALWDSLGYLVLYLDSLPGEKVIALLSDGEDLGSIRWDSFDEVTKLAATARNLSVFPIGLGVSRATASQTRSRLGALARQTGGEFFEIKQGERLPELFKKILRRLESRLYISYVPEEGRTGRVRVRVREGVPCRLRSLGSSRWLERERPPARSPGDHSATAGLTAFSGFAESLDCICPGQRQAVVGEPAVSEKLQIVSGKDGRSLFAILDSGDAILGYAEDLLQERGPLFDGKSYRTAGRLRVDLEREPLVESREVAILTPPLALIRARLASPEDLLLFLLESRLCAPGVDGHVPFLVHGRTFLELRETLGRALLLAREDYRSWAATKVEDDVEEDLRALLAGRPESESLDVDEQRRLRTAMIEQASDDYGGASRLAGWLGDLPAGDVRCSLEAKLINMMLSGESEVPARVKSSWHMLGRWFPPATNARIVTPLVPAYDPAREEIGFFRFILPRPQAHGPQPMVLPDRPLALLAVDQLADQLQGAEVTGVSYQPASRQEIRRVGCAEKIGKNKGGLKVSVGLDNGRRVVAYYPQDATGDALCINLLN